MPCNSFAAKANHKITIQYPAASDTAYGGQSITWTTSSQVWAQIRPVSAGEAYRQQQNQSSASHVFTIRYQSALADLSAVSDWRISYSGRLFGIRGIKNLDADMKSEGIAYQEIMAEENADYAL